MSRIAQPNYSETLKEIRKSIQSLSNEISEIKSLLFKIHNVKEEEELQK